MTNEKLNKIYQYLASNNIKNFPTTYEDFEVMMQDDEKASKIHGFLLSRNIKNVDADYDMFKDYVGFGAVKKKGKTFQDYFVSGQKDIPFLGLSGLRPKASVSSSKDPQPLPPEGKEADVAEAEAPTPPKVGLNETFAKEQTLTSVMQSQQKIPQYLETKTNELADIAIKEVQEAVDKMTEAYKKKIETNPESKKELKAQFEKDREKLIQDRTDKLQSDAESIIGKGREYEYLDNKYQSAIDKEVRNIVSKPMAYADKKKALDDLQNTILSQVSSLPDEDTAQLKAEIGDAIARSSVLNEQGIPTIYGWKREVEAKKQNIDKVADDMLRQRPDLRDAEALAAINPAIAQDKGVKEYLALRKASNEFNKTLNLPDDGGNFWQGFGSQGRAMMSAGFSELFDALDIKTISSKQTKGQELNKGEQAVLDAYGIYETARNSEEIGKWYQRGVGIAQSVAWMESFALTSGLGGVGEKAAIKALSNRVKNKVLQNIIKGAGGGVTRTPFLAGGYTEVAKRTTGTPELTTEGTWKIDETSIEPTWKAIGKGAYSNFTEAFSETAGGWLKGTGFARNVAKRLGLGSIPKHIKNYANVVGFQMAGELPEEYLAALLQTPVMGDTTLKEAFSAENMWETAVQVGLMTGAMGSAALPSITANNIKRANNKQLIDIFGKDNIVAIRDAIMNNDNKAFSVAIKNAFAGKSYADLEGMSLEKAQKRLVEYAHSIGQQKGAEVAQEEIGRAVEGEPAKEQITKTEEEISDAERVRTEVEEGRAEVTPELVEGEEAGVGVRELAEDRVEAVTGEEVDVNTLEKEMGDIEDKLPNEKDPAKYDAFQERWTQIEKILEDREKSDVFNTPLDEVSGVLDNLLKKEEEMPNGYGTFAEGRDLRESKDVVDRYLDAESLSDTEVMNDFVSALRGRPTTWYADGLKLRESAKEASQRGISFETLIKKATEVYTREGYTNEESLRVVKGFLDEVFEGAQKPKLELPTKPLVAPVQETQEFTGREQDEYLNKRETVFETDIDNDLDLELEKGGVKERGFKDFEVGRFPDKPVILYRGIKDPELESLLGEYDKEGMGKEIKEPLARAVKYNKQIKGGEFNSPIERKYGASYAGDKGEAVKAAQAIRRGYKPTGEDFVFGGEASPKYILTVDARGSAFGVLRKTKFKGENKIDIREFDIARGINTTLPITRIIKIERINEDGTLTDVSGEYGRFVSDNYNSLKPPKEEKPRKGIKEAKETEIIPEGVQKAGTGFERFADIVRQSDTLEEAFNKIQEIKDVPSEDSKAFRERYDPEGKLTPKQAFGMFYSEVKAEALAKQPTKAEQLKEKEEQAKAKIASALDRLAGKMGVIKELTGEERSAVIDDIIDIIEGLTELAAVKGEQLFNAVKEQLKSNKIVVPDEIVQEAVDKYEKKAPQEVISEVSEALTPESEPKVSLKAEKVSKERAETKKREIGRKVVEDSILPQEVKDDLLEYGIDYIPRGKKITQKEANELIRVLTTTEGGLEALEKAVYDITSEIPDDTRTTLNVYIAEHYSKQLNDATSVKAREAIRKKLSDAFIFGQEAATRYGQAVEAQKRWGQILARDPEAIIVIRKRAQSKNNQDALQAMKPDIKAAKDMLDNVVQSSEFKKLLEQRVNEEIDKIGTKKFGAVDKKKIDDFFKSLKIKDDRMFDATIGIPIAVYNGALEIIHKAVVVGVDIVNATAQAVEYIDNWYKENYAKKSIPSPDWNKDDYIAVMQERLKPLSKKVSKVKYKVPKKVEDRLVDDIYAKMESATKPQLRRLVRDYIATLDAEGVVTEERFTDMFARALGLDVLTEADSQSIRLAGQSINHARKKADDLLKAFDDYIEEAEKKTPDTEKLAELENKIKEKKKEAQKARFRAQKAAQELDKMLQEEITLGQTMATLIQGNLLTVISLVTNIVGNVAFIPVRAAKTMVASGLDLLVTNLAKAYTPILSKIDTTKHPRLKKYIAGLPTPQRVYSNFAAVHGYAVGFGSGTAEGTRQMVTGQLSEDIYNRDLMRSLEPVKAAQRLWAQLSGNEQFVFNKFIADFLEALPGGYTGEFFFRALNWGDKPFRRGAETARLYEIADLKGLKGAAKQRFLANPDEDTIEEMRKAGAVSVYQQDSVISRGISQIKKQLNSTSKVNSFKRASIIAKTLANLFISTMAPYVKTPLNLIAEAFDYSMPIYSLARGIEETRRGNRRKAMDFFGKAIVGHIIIGLAITLLKEGILTPPPDEDEKVRQAQYTGKPGYMINIDALMRRILGQDTGWQDGDKLWSIQRFGVPSMILMGVAKAYSEIPPDEFSDMSYLLRNVMMLPHIASASLDQSFLTGMATGLSAFTEGGPALDNWLINTSKALSATVYPNTLAQLSQTFANDNYIKEVRNIYDRDKKFEEQIRNTFKDRMFMGKDLPAKVSIWGERVNRIPEGRSWPYMLFDITKRIEYQKSSFGVQMFEFYERYKFIDETTAKGILPSLPSATNQVGWDNRNMTPEEVEALQVNVGSTRRMYVEFLMSSAEWQALDDEERIVELSRIYRECASKVKSQMFMLDILKTNDNLWQYMINNDFTPVPTRRIVIEVNRKKVQLDEEQTRDYYDMVQRSFLEKFPDDLKIEPIEGEKSIESARKRFKDKWKRARDVAEREMREQLRLGEID